jgi:hypothetical protein
MFTRISEGNFGIRRDSSHKLATLALGAKHSVSAFTKVACSDSMTQNGLYASHTSYNAYIAASTAGEHFGHNKWLGTGSEGTVPGNPSG